MIDNRIINEILRGEKVRISVECKDEHRLCEFQDWLTQFRETNCVSRRECVNCNSIRNIQGRLRLDVRLEGVPPKLRQLLAGTLQSMMVMESKPPNSTPLTIVRIE